MRQDCDDTARDARDILRFGGSNIVVLVFFKTATKEGVLFINTTNFYTVTKSKETRKVTLRGRFTNYSCFCKNIQLEFACHL